MRFPSPHAFLTCHRRPVRPPRFAVGRLLHRNLQLGQVEGILFDAAHRRVARGGERRAVQAAVELFEPLHVVG